MDGFGDRYFRRMAIPVAALFLAALLPARLFAADLLPREEVDRFVRPLTDDKWAAGIVVGLINDRGKQVLGYGKASDAADAKAPDGDTVFEIGSITKVFTATLLAEMAEDKTVGLNDPVKKYLPGSVKVPTRNGKEITLLLLATQHSGLPRMPDNFAPRDPNNPYADYTVDNMYAFLGSCVLQRDPGAAYEYSNLGVGLLGHALSRKAGKSYEELIVRRVCKPLNMLETRITLDQGLRARLAPGHDADGSPTHNWDLPTFAGAGALRSTTNDMMKFVSANLGLTRSEISAALEATLAVRAEAGEGQEIGLGWHIQKKRKFIWHNGQTGGYHSYAAFDPQHKTGVVVLSNSATGLIDEAGARLLQRLNGEPLQPIPLRKTAKVAPEVLKRYIGQYSLTPLVTATVTRDGDQLSCQLTGQPRFHIYPESDTKFYWRVVDAQVTFKKDDNGNVTRLVIHQNGQDIPAPRVK